MYKIMIIEDDGAIISELEKLIRSWGMDAVHVTDFDAVISEYARYSPHLILIDIGLPHKNGYLICQELRRVSKVPIVFISSASDSMNIIMAMNMGADDFIAKPFESNVLIAKLQALLRRTYDFADSVPVIEHRGAIFNTGDGTLDFNGKRIPLTKNEHRILLILLKHKGRAVSREKLMEALWQTDEFVDENALSVNIGRLRKKLDSAGLVNFIETKFGVGYLIS